MKIFLDDIRLPLEGDWNIVRTAEEAIELIKKEKVTDISFDHDLSENIKSGYKEYQENPVCLHRG